MLVESNSNIAQCYLTGSRCGWICRALRNIANFASNIPIIGTKLKSNIDMLADAVSFIEDQFSPSGKALQVDYEPTASEATILNNWVNNKLQPYYRTLATELANISTVNTFQEQVNLANNVLQKMCLIVNYFASRETVGLSTNAIYLRVSLIENIFEPLHEIIEATFNNKDLDIVNVKAAITQNNLAEFNPLITVSGSTSNCTAYKITSTSVADNLPADLVVPNNTTLPSIANNNKADKTIGLIVLGVALIAWLWPNNKKSKNES